MSGTFDQTMAQIDEWEQQAVRQAEAATQLQERAAAMRVSAASPRGTTTVTVDSSGVVTRLDLSRRALQQTPSALAQEILHTMRRAQARLSDEMAAAVAATMGSGQVAGSLTASYRERFGVAEPGRAAQQVAPAVLR